MEDDLLRRDRGKREGPPSPLTQRGRIARIHPASRHQTAFSTAFPPDCCRMRRARRDGLQPHQGPNPQPTRFPTRAAVPIPREDYAPPRKARSEEHTSELQSLMRLSYAVFCLKQKT